VVNGTSACHNLYTWHNMKRCDAFLSHTGGSLESTSACCLSCLLCRYLDRLTRQEAVHNYQVALKGIDPGGPPDIFAAVSTTWNTNITRTETVHCVYCQASGQCVETAYHTGRSVVSLDVVHQVIACQGANVFSRTQDGPSQRAVLESCCMKVVKDDLFGNTLYLHIHHHSAAKCLVMTWGSLELSVKSNETYAFRQVFC